MADKTLDLGEAYADITDPDVYVTGVPHATFKRLRNEDPVSWWEPKDGGRGFWAVTRYDDAIEVSHQPEIFSSAKGIRLEDMDEEELAARKTMMEMDRPEHTDYRRLVQPPFLPRSINANEDAIRKLARKVINNVHSETEFDFVEEIARKLPMQMLGALLGVPEEDYQWLVDMGDALIGNADPEFTDHPVDLVDTDAYRLMPFRSPYSKDLFDYAGEQAKANHQDNLIAYLLEVKRDGEHLTENEFKNFFTLMVAAGNDTTRYTMAAGMDALLQNPEQHKLLSQNPDMIDTAVEEMLRWGSVTMHFRRTATEDIHLNGADIKAGDKVVMYYISADFDERQFPNPYAFDIQRNPNAHMAFGLKSPHKCLGEHLARVEIKILYEELLPLIDEVEIAGPIERLRSNFISGIKHLPIRVQWAG